MRVQPRSRPLLFALVMLIPVYLLVQFMTGQLFLAVVMAALVGLLALLSYRLAQLKGKLTLGILVIGLPLLLALVFTGLHQLRPFWARQHSVNLLRRENIVFREIRPDRAGEWIRDRFGNMLPVWLAESIGPDCLSEVRGIEGDLLTLQSMPLDQIDSTHLRKVVLRRYDDATPIAQRLIEWLNRIEPERLSISLSELGEADVDALSKLTTPAYLTLEEPDSLTGDLSKLPLTVGLKLLNVNLNEIQAGQLVERLHRGLVNLQVCRLTEPVVRVWNAGLLGKHGHLSLQSMTVDDDAWTALTQTDGLLVDCHDFRIGTRDYSAFSFAFYHATEGPEQGQRILNIYNGSALLKETEHLLETTRASTLELNRNWDEAERERLWAQPSLQRIIVPTGSGKKTLVR